MLKHVGLVNTRERLALLNKFDWMLEKPVPREVPGDIRSCLIPSMIKFGLAFIAMGILTLIVFACLDRTLHPVRIVGNYRIEYPGGYPRSPGVNFPHKLSMFIYRYMFFTAGGVLIVISLWTMHKRTNTIKYGELYEGKITGIKLYRKRHYGQTTYIIFIEICKNDQPIKCYSYIRGEIIEYFYNMMNSGKNNLIDVIYHKDEEVILPLNIIMANRYSNISNDNDWNEFIEKE